jgi:N-acetylglucosaminyldiphosphoundecaprenol N-acetyl-beta-D-mannosaminyltransferase
MKKTNSIKLLNVEISKISYHELLEYIDKIIEANQKKVISYAAFHIVNIAKRSNSLADKINSFDVVHGDGIGVYLASKFLYGIEGLNKKITGSDFYPLLIDLSVKRGWKFFFFGDKVETLKKIQLNNPGLQVLGFKSGFGFDDRDVIHEINSTQSDILVIGLGCPLQETWVFKNKELINANVILIVGDGIKVFAGTKKRGNKLVQKIGIEWFSRLLFDPIRMWKRYLVGIPLFLFRIIKFKFHSS